MKYISPLISDARNKLGGNVFARNRAGVYARARVSPSQPRTTAQQANRATFASLSSTWRTLSQSQISGWNALAATQTLTDTLGHSFAPSGSQLFMRCNLNLAHIDTAPISDPPGPPPAFPQPAWTNIILQEEDNVLNFVSLDPDGPLVSSPMNCIFRLTGPLSPGITFVKPSLYRTLFQDLIENYPFDLTSPYIDTYGSTMAAGQQVGFCMQVIDPLTGYGGLPSTLLITCVEGE